MLTATVTTTEIKAGLRYTVTLSNGLVVTRQSSQPKAAIGFHLEGVSGEGCRTTVSKDINTLRRDLGGREGFVIVDLNTGALTDCSQLPKHVKGLGTARTALNGNGMTEAQAKQFERFCNAPARLVKRFLKTADYYASCGSSDHLKRLIKRHTDAAEACREITQETLIGLWNTGARTSGDLERVVEKSFGI